MRKVLRFIDSTSIHTAGLLKFLCYALVLDVTYDVVMRYIFNAPPQWAYDMAVMLGGSIYILSWGYTHLHKAHVRVDVFYTHLSPRRKALIDTIGTVFLTFPLLATLIYISLSYALESWAINEKWKETYWYPPMYPFRTAVFIAYCLFALQVLAQFVRDIHLLVKKVPYD